MLNGFCINCNQLGKRTLSWSKKMYLGLHNGLYDVKSSHIPVSHLCEHDPWSKGTCSSKPESGRWCKCRYVAQPATLQFTHLSSIVSMCFLTSAVCENAFLHWLHYLGFSRPVCLQVQIPFEKPVHFSHLLHITLHALPGKA